MELKKAITNHGVILCKYAFQRHEAKYSVLQVVIMIMCWYCIKWGDWHQHG